MSTKYSKKNLTGNSSNSLQTTNIPDDFKLPSCGIEDVDRAVYNLFFKDLPLFYKTSNGIGRVPVNFASGERAFIREKPYLDINGTIILPIVSVLRMGIDQASVNGDFGLGPGDGTLEISRRKFKDSVDYLNKKNKEGIENQKNIATGDKHVGSSSRNYRKSSAGIYIDNNLSSPVTEIISIPSPKYFSAKYEITFWTQHLQQMNSMLEALLTSYHSNPGKSFRLESDKGWWFVGYVDSLSEDFNFDNMTDEERIMKYVFNISVNGYIINPDFIGSQTTVRSTVSSPEIVFDTKFTSYDQKEFVSVPSGYTKDYINSDLDNFDDPLPGSAVGKNSVPSYGITPNTSEEDIENMTPVNTSIGGQQTGGEEEYVKVENYYNPLTNKTEQRKVLVKTKRSRYGETVHIIIPIGN